MSTVVERHTTHAAHGNEATGKWNTAARWIIAVVVLVAAWLYVRPVVAAIVSLWTWGMPGGFGTDPMLRSFAAVLPGLIIAQHGAWVAVSRRKQFRQALGSVTNADEQKNADELVDLYFGYGSITIRYLIPTLLVTTLTAIVITALLNPGCHLPWLYLADPSATANPQAKDLASLCVSGKLTPWPTGWAAQVLRGAGLGFVGAYAYLLILLTDRARRRDLTTGIAVWAAAMPVLGPLVGGVAALLIVAGTGAVTGSFTQDAVYFVAGMLPRQFAFFVQSGVSKIFQNAPQLAVRSVPLTTLRGIGPDVQARLEEEGIYDVSSLAYSSPHQLLRATTYAPRQIVDWIDESLLIVTLPMHWQALENLGINGAMDLAWYDLNPNSIPRLAEEIKLAEPMLRDAVARLWQDAQVQDLYKLYWDHTGLPPNKKNLTTPGAMVFSFKREIGQDARERFLAEVRTADGVTSAVMDGDHFVVTADDKVRAGLQESLSRREEVQS